MDWPRGVEELIAEQRRLAAAPALPWMAPAGTWTVGGCFVCSPSGKTGSGEAGDRSWAGAAVVGPDGLSRIALVDGSAAAPYEAGLLALREGALLERAVRALPIRPDVLLVDATGRDHPRRAGLALHLGAMLDLPTVGVTHRALLAAGDWPQARRGARSPLVLDNDVVGVWLCTRDGTRPLAVHAAWRTDPVLAAEIVLRATTGARRAPEPLRLARQAARTARAVAEGRAGFVPRPVGSDR
jgi:deoxyribonuclease V